jgi:hypothetical protein
LVAVTPITVQAKAIPAANRPGVMRAINGNIEAIRTIAADGFFSPQGRG